MTAPPSTCQSPSIGCAAEADAAPTQQIAATSHGKRRIRLLRLAMHVALLEGRGAVKPRKPRKQHGTHNPQNEARYDIAETGDNHCVSPGGRRQRTRWPSSPSPPPSARALVSPGARSAHSHAPERPRGRVRLVRERGRHRRGASAPPPTRAV